MDRIEKLCLEKGMRMTDQRRVVARILSAAQDHPDVEELYRRAAEVDPNISIATVYRTVRLFEEAGIVIIGLSFTACRWNRRTDEQRHKTPPAGHAKAGACQDVWLSDECLRQRADDRSARAFGLHVNGQRD